MRRVGEQTHLVFGDGAPGAVRVRRSQRRTGAPKRAIKPQAPERQEALPLARKIDDASRLRLQRRIGAHMSGSLTVTVTDNCYSMITVKRGRGKFEARLHHMFVDADPKIVRALARYISKNDSAASRVLNEYIDRNQDKIRRALPARPRSINLNTAGEYFSLDEIFDALNERYFANKVEDVRITWGRRKNGTPRRHTSVKMGSYSVEDRLIRIHPCLDRPFVPRFFVESVVFHEMLHSVHDIPIVNGRHRFHTPEFLAHERTFEWYDASRRWERENLNRLLYF